MKILAFLAVLALLQMVQAPAESIYDIPVKDIDGKDTTLAPFKGKVMLIVNVASKCGFTPQYEGLEALYETNKDKGLVVLGFPCNQFWSQEPGSNAEIKEFCSSKFHVTFPMFDKIDVNGSHRHPLYVHLAGKESPQSGSIKWNFTKFLISRDGRIINRFGPFTKPNSSAVLKAVAEALEEK